MIRKALFSLLILGGAANCASEGDVCTQAANHIEECTGRAFTFEGSCNEAGAEDLLALSCTELGAGEDSSDLNDPQFCLDRCIESFGVNGQAGCENLCQTTAVENNIGAVCDPSGSICTGSFCHPILNRCTKECNSACPGGDSVCVDEADWSSTLMDQAGADPNELGGVCLKKAESNNECGENIYMYSNGCYDTWIYFELKSVRSESVCIPTEVERYTCGGGGGGCFVEDTMIDTPDGPRPIQDIREGDTVYSMNTDTHQLTLGRVTRNLVFEDREVGHIRLANGKSFVATPDHPFYVPSRDLYQTPSTLDVGDELLNVEINSSPALPASEWGMAMSEMSSFEGFTPSPSTTTVYNFTVEPEHNYFVDGVLVHNR